MAVFQVERSEGTDWKNVLVLESKWWCVEQVEECEEIELRKISD